MKIIYGSTTWVVTHHGETVLLSTYSPTAEKPDDATVSEAVGLFVSMESEKVADDGAVTLTFREDR